MRILCGFLLMLILISGCQQEQKEPVDTNRFPNWKFQKISNPCQSGGESNLVYTTSDELILSWVEYINDSTDALYLSYLQDTTWAAATEVARGSNWFVNWADFPSVQAFPNKEKYLAAHWLQKSDVGTYDYDVRISISPDKGKTWEPSFVLHNDQVAAEHGFASLIPSGDHIKAFWLDGRKTKKEQPMTIRTASIAFDGTVTDRIELDNSVCDCCQTSATPLDVASEKAMLAYRDRSENELRDISVIHNNDQTWSAPSIPHPDHWKIAGCPVNGPSVDFRDSILVMTWFTAANGKPAVYLSFSTDKGSTFGDKYRIDTGQALGRVDVSMLKDGSALVSWVEATDESAEILLRQVRQNGEMGKEQFLSKFSPSRGSGFPRMASNGEQIWISFTEYSEEKQRVKTYQGKPEEL